MVCPIEHETSLENLDGGRGGQIPKGEGFRTRLSNPMTAPLPKIVQSAPSLSLSTILRFKFPY